MPVTNTLEGRVAIVTGAASGIGREIARLFASQGALVVVADISTESAYGGAPTPQLIASEGGKAQFIATDVSREEAVEALVKATVAEHGQLDVVVNNAATYAALPLLDTSVDEWERVMATNVTGTFLLCRAAVRQMTSQPARSGGVKGRIVNVASQYAFIAVPNDTAYGTSKAAIVHLTRQVARDYVAHGVICNAVAPGRILCKKPGLDDNAESLALAHARTPYPRLGTPEDVGRAVLFLASDEATYISGETLVVDGGWLSS